MLTLLIIVLSIIAFWAFTRFYLIDESLVRFDRPVGSDVKSPPEPSDEHFDVLKQLEKFVKPEATGTAKTRLAAMRKKMDAMGDSIDLSGVIFQKADIAGIAGEWVLAEGADPDKRLLYLHGGAFTMGSPKSHRTITTKLSKVTGAAVLAVDYRLMPEHKRLDGVMDCKSAYRWIINNGPDGPALLKTLFVAGDSAGGNLALVVVAWARDRCLRAADGVVVLSPLTDGTLTSPTVSSNLKTDHMLGPLFSQLALVPKVLMPWMGWAISKVRPCDPNVSPVHGNLSGLPPTLIHASESEMLLGDAHRYANKAKLEGSEVVLETWHHMVHVWHIYEPILPEAKDAFDSIAVFLNRCAPR